MWLGAKRMDKCGEWAQKVSKDSAQLTKFVEVAKDECKMEHCWTHFLI